MDGIDFNIQRLAVQFVPFVIAVVFHEYAHGFVAKRWGDSTAEDHGRLTLNPIPHLDPVGTLFFPIILMLTGVGFLFGWARPVPIDPRRFRSYRPGLFWVSFAGPLTNFALAILSAFAYCAILLWVPKEFYLHEPFLRMAQVSIILNFALGFFNLIPLPPLDGSKMVQSFLSPRATLKYEQLARYSFFILIALLMTGALKYIMAPVWFLTSLTLGVTHFIFGIPAQPI